MIIYLNGTSSSGKSSIAYKLQEAIKEPVFYFSIDTLFYTLSKKTIEAIEGKRKLEVDINFDNIFKGYFDCAAALANANNYIICDCPIYMESQNNFFNEAFSNIKNKFIVGIDCNLEELKKRELNRGDRRIGLAENQLKTIHTFLNYNLKVNSSELLPEQISQKIISCLE